MKGAFRVAGVMGVGVYVGSSHARKASPARLTSSARESPSLSERCAQTLHLRVREGEIGSLHGFLLLTIQHLLWYNQSSRTHTGGQEAC